MQKPDASLVAGFNKWKDSFGRNVKRGEKGIKIIAPAPFKKKIEKEKFISITKNAGEFKFENGSKDRASTILMSILQIWKQHIMYLNNEENRYLIELRDALLPDLMSGKIEL